MVTFCYHGNRGTSSGYRGGGVLVTFCYHGNRGVAQGIGWGVPW